MASSSFQLILQGKDDLTGVLRRAQSAVKTFADQVQTGNEVLKQAAGSIKVFADALNSGITTFLEFKEKINQISKGQAEEQDQRAKRRSEILTAAMPELQGHMEAKKQRDEQLEEFKGELLTQLAIWNNYFKDLAKIKKEERDKEKKADIAGQKETQEEKVNANAAAEQAIQKNQKITQGEFLKGWAESWKKYFKELGDNAKILNDLGTNMAKSLQTGFEGILKPYFKSYFTKEAVKLHDLWINFWDNLMRDMREKLQTALVDMVTNTMMRKLFSAEVLAGKGGGFLGKLFSFVKFAQGGIVAGALRPIAEFANGGIVGRRTLAVVGEGGPEAIVPLKNGAIRVVAPPNSFGGGTGTVIQIGTYVEAVNAIDAMTFRAHMAQHGDLVTGMVDANIRGAGHLRNYFRKD